MTFKEAFRKDVLHMKKYNDQIEAAGKAFDVDLYEGFLGTMMDDLFHYILEPYVVLAGEENEDQALEWLWSLVIDTKDSDEDDIERFYDKFLKKVQND